MYVCIPLVFVIYSCLLFYRQSNHGHIQGLTASKVLFLQNQSNIQDGGKVQPSLKTKEIPNVGKTTVGTLIQQPQSPKKKRKPVNDIVATKSSRKQLQSASSHDPDNLHNPDERSLDTSRSRGSIKHLRRDSRNSRKSTNNSCDTQVKWGSSQEGDGGDSVRDEDSNISDKHRNKSSAQKHANRKRDGSKSKQFSCLPTIDELSFSVMPFNGDVKYTPVSHDPIDYAVALFTNAR